MILVINGKMDSLTIKAREKFTFFVDEEGQFGIRVTTLKGKDVAQVIMAKEDVNDIITFIDDNYDDIA